MMMMMMIRYPQDENDDGHDNGVGDEQIPAIVIVTIRYSQYDNDGDSDGDENGNGEWVMMTITMLIALMMHVIHTCIICVVSLASCLQ